MDDRTRIRDRGIRQSCIGASSMAVAIIMFIVMLSAITANAISSTWPGTIAFITIILIISIIGAIGKIMIDDGMEKIHAARDKDDEQFESWLRYEEYNK